MDMIPAGASNAPKKQKTDGKLKKILLSYAESRYLSEGCGFLRQIEEILPYISKKAKIKESRLLVALTGLVIETDPFLSDVEFRKLAINRAAEWLAPRPFLNGFTEAQKRLTRRKREKNIKKKEKLLTTIYETHFMNGLEFEK